MKTVVGLYDRFDEAQQTVKELRDAGFRSEDISLVARDAKGEYARDLEGQQPSQGQDLSDGTAKGAGIGAVLGGLGGLLVGLGALAIPGIGPVLAAGPLVSALAGAGVGAVAGGILGALVDLGIPEEHAQYYAEGIRRGGTLVVVRADDNLADQSMNVMNRHNPVDVGRRSENWRKESWSGFDANGQPLTEDHLEFNRSRSNVPVTGESNYVNYDVMDRVIPGSNKTNSDLFNEDHMDHTTNSDLINEDRMDHTTKSADDQNFTSGGLNRQMSDVPVTSSTDDVPFVKQDKVIMDDVWQPHYQSYYSRSGRDYNYYQPAYSYGYELRNNAQYSNYSWDQLEPSARQDWQRRGIGGAWEDVKDAVRYGWERIS